MFTHDTGSCVSEAGTAFDFDARSAAVDSVHSQTAIYTASHVVDSLLARLGWPNGKTRLLDPSCGDGAFLLAALEQLKLMPNDTDSALRVRGCEIHPGAASECRERVEEFLCSRSFSPHIARQTARSIVIEADFLTDGAGEGTFDIVAANPPYLRFGHLPDYFKALYSMTVKEYARGDLLHMFLDRCCEILPPSGVIGLVTSDRWISNSTAAKLRGSMGKLVGLDHIERLDCATAFYRPKRRVKGSLPRVHPIALVLRPKAQARWTISEDVINPEEVSLPAYTGRTLADIADVRIAPWLGPVGAFVVNGEKAKELDNAQLIPAVDTDDIDAATGALRAPNRWAIRTTKEAEPAGPLQRHLREWAPKMPKRSATRPYWLPPESITLPLDKPALLVPRISKTLRAIHLPAGVCPLNHNLSVVANGAGYTLEEVKELITCAKSQEWFRRNAQRLEGGYYSVITTLLRRLPIE